MKTERFLRSTLSAGAAALVAACSGQTNAGLSSAALPQTHRVVSYASSTCPAYFNERGLVLDGDFREANDPGNGYVRYTQDAAFAPDWVVKKGSIDFAGSTYWNIGGLCSVNLDGHPSGTIATRPFRTVKGQQYEVTFLISGAGCEGIGKCSDVERMAVRAGGQEQVYQWITAQLNDVQHGKYLQATWYFTARQSQSVLLLRSLDRNNSRRGCVVTGISVVSD